ncbi:hypothetical protein SAMN05444722_1136 [Rhodovulum sp. ES.010]|uniref:hypothetical protein n=1 Tax=Rhodovulum sp. ES.010 TaxID=1882821 RepID=UPI00092C6A1E|nr:hypothetical protein [Rhodovulum sp. ES.010]SIO27406.1 hypothetical protein SAMN05444722_1136 [Rhodovulum sp. ES.010]
MTGPKDPRFFKSLIEADRLVTDVRWNLKERGCTPFSDFFGVSALTCTAPRAALTCRRTPLSSLIHLPLIWRRRSRTRLWTGARLLSWR